MKALLLTIVIAVEAVVLGLCFAIAFGGDWSPLATFVLCWGGACAVMVINGLDDIGKDMRGY